VTALGGNNVFIGTNDCMKKTVQTDARARVNYTNDPSIESARLRTAEGELFGGGPGSAFACDNRRTGAIALTGHGQGWTGAVFLKGPAVFLPRLPSGPIVRPGRLSVKAGVPAVSSAERYPEGETMGSPASGTGRSRTGGVGDRAPGEGLQACGKSTRIVLSQSQRPPVLAAGRGP
jgi:hypothetical protein